MSNNLQPNPRHTDGPNLFRATPTGPIFSRIRARNLHLALMGVWRVQARPVFVQWPDATDAPTSGAPCARALGQIHPKSRANHMDLALSAVSRRKCPPIDLRWNVPLMSRALPTTARTVH